MLECLQQCKFLRKLHVCKYHVDARGGRRMAWPPLNHLEQLEVYVLMPVGNINAGAVEPLPICGRSMGAPPPAELVDHIMSYLDPLELQRLREAPLLQPLAHASRVLQWSKYTWCHCYARGHVTAAIACVRERVYLRLVVGRGAG
jgi:hypothetical protein